MALALVILGTIPAYLAAGLALLMGADGLTALAVLIGTGTSVTLALAALQVVLMDGTDMDSAGDLD